MGKKNSQDRAVTDSPAVIKRKIETKNKVNFYTLLQSFATLCQVHHPIARDLFARAQRFANIFNLEKATQAATFDKARTVNHKIVIL